MNCMHVVFLQSNAVFHVFYHTGDPSLYQESGMLFPRILFSGIVQSPGILANVAHSDSPTPNPDTHTLIHTHTHTHSHAQTHTRTQLIRMSVSLYVCVWAGW